jgi:hypothetical protein
MNNRSVLAPLLLSALLGLALAAFTCGVASADEYAVVNCEADTANYSTHAFEPFATRGMRIRRACKPDGPGMRGLITGSRLRGGRVPRGSIAKLTLQAPPGTRFSRFRWKGTMRRSECRFAMQLYADAPDVRPIPLQTIRANERCPRRGMAQAAATPSKVWDIPGATRVIQRVICMGRPGKPACSTRDYNYVRTWEAEVVIVDDSPPVATIIPDTPLARGEWVNGSQPINYDASDNVGVRSVDAFNGARSAGLHPRPCALGGTDKVLRNPSLVRTVRGRSQSIPMRYSRGRSPSCFGRKTQRTTSARPRLSQPGWTARLRAVSTWCSKETNSGAAPMTLAWYGSIPGKTIGHRSSLLYTGCVAKDALPASKPALGLAVSPFKFPRLVSGSCLCGVVTPQATKASRRHRQPSPSATTRSHPSWPSRRPIRATQRLYRFKPRTRSQGSPTPRSR